MPDIYLEDMHPGQVIDCGSATVRKEDIIRFAQEFDPQPFHTDEEAARSTPVGGLIASGWHTGSLCMRLAVDALLHRVASVGSPGIDELRWLKPVRPGDTLHLRIEVLEVTPSTSRPDRGKIKTRYVGTNQHGETVITMVGWGIFLKRA